MTLKTIKLLIMVVTLSYFTGVVWIIICELNYDYMRNRYEKGLTDQKFFRIEYEFDKYENWEIMIKA